MVAIEDDGAPVHFVGCGPIYKVPQTKWTARLAVQLTAYVLFIGLSMAAGGLMPWLLETFYGWKIDGGNSLFKMYSEDQGYVYDNSNTYAFCPKQIRYSYAPLQRGYPAAPLAPQGGRLYDAWYHKQVVLKGVSWFGFNNKQGMVDGLWAGGSSAATDMQAVAYELKLLGFNTIRLPFTFDMLKQRGLNQVQKCASSTKTTWAKRATDPDLSPQPEYAGVPDPPVYLSVPATSKHLCNTYLPGNSTASVERLMWTIQYLVASGFYVVLNYHPDPTDTLALDVEGFARAWMYTWAAVTCLPNYASDIRGRLLLDLLNEPDKVGATGLGWTRSGDVPGLDELYLTTMDTIESITPNDALFMLQGSVLSKATGTGGRQNKVGLSAGDGFVTDAAIISKYDFTDPRRFFNELLKRPYKSRVLLAPHLYGPSVSGVPAAPPFEVAARVDSSWGVLATDGYCNGNQCMRLPVVAGEMGSHLTSDDDLTYYDAIAQYTQLGIVGDGSESPLVGWIWWAYNANSNGTGGLTTENWQDLVWPKVRYLIDYYGLKPWYENPAAFVMNSEAEKADALAARAAADAAAVSAAAVADSSAVNFTNLAVVTFGAKPAAAAGAGPQADITTAAGGLKVPTVVEDTPSGAATAAPPSAAAAPIAAATKPAVPAATLQQPIAAAVRAFTAAVQSVAAAITGEPVAPAVVRGQPASQVTAAAASDPGAIPVAPPPAGIPAPGWLPATANSQQSRPVVVGTPPRPSNLVGSIPGSQILPASVSSPVAAGVQPEGDEGQVATATTADSQQPGAISTTGQQQSDSSDATTRTLLAESQLPALPSLTDIGQLETAGDLPEVAVTAAEKTAKTAARGRATLDVAAAARVLL